MLRSRKEEARGFVFQSESVIAIYCIRVSSQAHSVPHLDMAGLDRKEEGINSCD